MTLFNLMSEDVALDYLKSLSDLTVIDLPGAGDVKPCHPAAVAVSVITGQSAHVWAASKNRWEWPIRDLIRALEV